jgi:hypothetical protein
LQRAAVDEKRDTRIVMGANGHGAEGGGFNPSRKMLDTVAEAFSAANEGRPPASLSELIPYAVTPEQQAFLQARIEQEGGAPK